MERRAVIGRNKRGKAQAVKVSGTQAAPEAALRVVRSEPEEHLEEVEARRVDFIWSAVMVGALGLVFSLLSVFGGVAVPVLLALAGAYVLNPFVTALERRGLHRAWGTSAVFAGCTLFLAGAVLYLVPVFRDEAAKLPDFFVRASGQVIPQAEALLGRPLPELLRHRMTELGGRASELLQSAGPTAARLVASFAGNTARFVATLLGLLVVPVLAFFFLQDYPQLVALVRGLVPRRAVGLVGRRFAEVDDVLSAFVRGQLTVGAILSVLYSMGLSFARIDMAIVIGVIAGFGNTVPYLGTGVGVVLALLGVMLSWQGAWQLAVVAGTFLVGQMAEGFFITPRVVGDKVGLSSVSVIIAILAFGELFGFTGILLAVPSTAILKVVLRVVVERYQRMPLYTGEKPGA
ncbi:AI-2E family transporter [Melittangium boletus]|uniref:AI-2E family transporter n=1 Tax=Melittangium boletus DSM 14713 TaxID=1294270 RepID=A0A250IQJ8_9BACT|nr:AI-2E family transporter [Melittangium boletus]ATB33441.1 AI-2E family transporter [Melittangium boletus DSM 14713]